MKIRAVVITVLLATMSMFGMASEAVAGWHDLTQTQRSQAIVNEANSWSNGSYGGQCKVWVQSEIVWDASSSTVWIPTNLNYCQWNPSSDVVGRSAILE